MKTTKRRKIVSSIISDLIILLFPQRLSPLHLASYYTDKKEKEREKRVNELAKKMKSIANHYTTIEGKTDAIDNHHHVALFYQVYEHLDSLTVRELKIVRDFCDALYNPYDLRIVTNEEIETEEKIYYQYHDILDATIEKRGKRKSNYRRK